MGISEEEIELEEMLAPLKAEIAIRQLSAALGFHTVFTDIESWLAFRTVVGAELVTAIETAGDAGLSDVVASLSETVLALVEKYPATRIAGAEVAP